MTGLPPAHPALSLETARALVDEQFPQYAGLELGPLAEGWDNAMIRLGSELAIRMPRLETTVGSLLKERELLHLLGESWTFPFPRIVADGEPGHGYPWPWSIVTWLEGELAVRAPLAASGAAQLGAAIAQIHSPAPDDAPFNNEQSLTLRERGTEVFQYLGDLGERLDTDMATRIWQGAVAAPAAPHPVWSHADLHGYNVLTGPGGTLAAIIDWGDMAACDPAVDLAFAYTLTDADGIEALFAAYLSQPRSDPGLLARVHGIGLHVSLKMAQWPSAETQAMGWRGLSALGVAKPADSVGA